MRYPLLNYLRGVAAVWVFAHHLAWSQDDITAPGLILRGYFGVPMFFVISGFCLAAAARTSRDRGESPGTFLTRRLQRVYPPLWAAIGVAVVAYTFGPLVGWPAGPFGAENAPPSWADRSARDWFSTLALTRVFAVDGPYVWRNFQFVNVVLWTLAIEVQFYLVVGLAMAARRWSRLVFVGVTVVSALVMFSPAAFRSGFFLPHWPMFALGLALYAIIERWPLKTSPRSSLRLAALGGAGVIMAVGLALAPAEPDGEAAMIGGEVVFASGFAAALWLLWGLPAPSMLYTPVFRLIVWAVGYAGMVSYSLYLLHVPFIRPARMIIGVSGWPEWVVDCLVVVLVAAVCYPFHRWFERPWTSSGRSRSPKSESISPPQEQTLSGQADHYASANA